MENEHINKQVEETLDSFNNVKRATPSPFFFTRLHARMNREPRRVWEKLASFLTKPQVALACIFVVAVINTAVIFSDDPNTNDPVEYVANDEYGQVTSGVYEIENVKP